MQRRATVVAELRASRIDVVAEGALGEGEEHGQHLDGKITSRRKSRSGEFRYLPKGDDGDLAYAEMHEIQPPRGRDFGARTFLKRVMSLQATLSWTTASAGGKMLATRSRRAQVA